LAVTSFGVCGVGACGFWRYRMPPPPDIEMLIRKKEHYKMQLLKPTVNIKRLNESSCESHESPAFATVSIAFRRLLIRGKSLRRAQHTSYDSDASATAPVAVSAGASGGSEQSFRHSRHQMDSTLLQTACLLNYELASTKTR